MKELVRIIITQLRSNHANSKHIQAFLDLQALIVIIFSYIFFIRAVLFNSEKIGRIWSFSIEFGHLWPCLHWTVVETNTGQKYDKIQRHYWRRKLKSLFIRSRDAGAPPVRVFSFLKALPEWFLFDISCLLQFFCNESGGRGRRYKKSRNKLGQCLGQVI